MPKSSRQLFLKKMIEVSSAKILEIGALDNPTFHKAEANIFYLDWFSQAELYLKHQYNNPQKAENLVEVDFVVKDKNFHKSINQEFDLVIANHVIEHIPHIIGWFNNVSSILKNDGFLFLYVPHKEYTFDKIRNLTSLSQIIRNYDEDLNIPTIYQVFEHLYGVAELGYDRLRIRLPKNNTSKNIELMQCPECQSSYVNKNGHKKGKQNYICVNCARQFIAGLSTS